MALPLCALAATSVVVPTAVASAQGAVDVSVGLRAGVAIHAAGLRLNSTYRHRIEPALTYGGSIGAGSRSGAIGLQLDAEVVPQADIRRDPKGPPLGRAASGRAIWLSTSLWVAPSWPCAWRCVKLLAGIGWSSYDYSVREQRGDIATPLAPKQRLRTGRYGLEVTLPFLDRRISMQAVDHVGTLKPYYAGESLSPLHTVTLSTGIRLRKW